MTRVDGRPPMDPEDLQRHAPEDAQHAVGLDVAAVVVERNEQACGERADVILAIAAVADEDVLVGLAAPP